MPQQQKNPKRARDFASGDNASFKSKQIKFKNKNKKRRHEKIEKNMND